MADGLLYPMIARVDMLLFAVMFIAISFVLIRQWKEKGLSKRKNECRKKAHGRLVAHRSRSDHPKYEFLGKDATVVLSREKFSPKSGHLAGTFIYLCRNAFDEYFFCVIDISFSAIHIPKERALSFLKNFPREYAAEIDYLSNR